MYQPSHKYKIGDTVWRSNWRLYSKAIECPDFRQHVKAWME